MSDTDRPSPGERPKHKPKRKANSPSAKRPSQPHYRPNTLATGTLNTGTFAKSRSYVDVVAFGTPGPAPIKVRLFTEAVEAFELTGREPRNFLLLLSRGLEVRDFEAFQIPFRRMKALLPLAEKGEGERSFWKLRFYRATQKLDAGPNTPSVELRRLEKRPQSKYRK